MLINNFKKTNNDKAWKISFLCLTSVFLTGFFSTSSIAQDAPVYALNNSGQTEIRMQQLETQIRDLTGKVEEQGYEINALKQKVKKLKSTATQSNLKKQNIAQKMGSVEEETAPVKNPLGLNLDEQEPKGMQTKTIVGGDVNNDATAQYEKSYADLKLSKYESAQKGFDLFLSQHPEHILAANAKYWLGETYYVRGDYKKSARVFAEGFQTYPDSAKSADILLKLGLSLKGLGKTKDACIALAQLPIKFPAGNGELLKRAATEREKLSCDS